jgi:hypothetical protein
VTTNSCCQPSCTPQRRTLCKVTFCPRWHSYKDQTVFQTFRELSKGWDMRSHGRESQSRFTQVLILSGGVKLRLISFMETAHGMWTIWSLNYGCMTVLPRAFCLKCIHWAQQVFLFIRSKQFYATEKNEHSVLTDVTMRCYLSLVSLKSTYIINKIYSYFTVNKL